MGAASGLYNKLTKLEVHYPKTDTNLVFRGVVDFTLFTDSIRGKSPIPMNDIRKVIAKGIYSVLVQGEMLDDLYNEEGNLYMSSILYHLNGGVEELGGLLSVYCVFAAQIYGVDEKMLITEVRGMLK